MEKHINDLPNLTSILTYKIFLKINQLLFRYNR